MNYISTRDQKTVASSCYAIANGISKEGGLYVPERFPQLSSERLLHLSKQSYLERAQEILAEYLTDFSSEELYRCVQAAYGSGFETEGIAGLAKVESAYLLELWHGPTCAFKDMALQLLPHLLVTAAQKTSERRELVILVATSGDTGKAALEGFCNVPGTRLLVFYPEQGVSPMQKLQMVTQEGENVEVCAIKGNFDDAQSAVKQIFTDPQMAQRLEEKGKMFSSANSINWGRLAPQIVYYVSAYCDLVAGEEIALGDKVNICVPTGNFGNILAAYYAKRMGLPVARLLCASNQNNVLTDFLRTGIYDCNRRFYTTISPSMDILISSNLERLLFHLSGNSDVQVRELMRQLAHQGRYTLPQEMFGRLQGEFWGGFRTDGQTQETIRAIYEECSYLCDPHTAVAVGAWQDYRHETGDQTPTIIASTASPFKFSGAVLQALGCKAGAQSEFELAQKLSGYTGCPVPQGIRALQQKTVRFTDVCGREEIWSYVQNKLNLG